MRMDLRLIWCFDEDPTVLQSDRVRPHRDHAGRRYHLTGAHVELAAVKIAFDDITAQEAIRQRARPMSARVVSDEVLTVQVEHSQNQALDFYLERASVPDVGRAAELDVASSNGHGRPGCQNPQCANRVYSDQSRD